MPFQGLLGAIETMRIIKELIEIWPNKVYDMSTQTWSGFKLPWLEPYRFLVGVSFTSNI